MFILHGIDRLKKIQPVGVFGADESSAGAMAVRGILHSTNIVIASSGFTMNIGLQNQFVYTVPTNYVFEVKDLNVLYVGGGAYTFIRLNAYDGVSNFIVNSIAALAVDSCLSFQGSLFFASGIQIGLRCNVTANGTSMFCSLFGVLWPNP